MSVLEIKFYNYLSAIRGIFKGLRLGIVLILILCGTGFTRYILAASERDELRVDIGLSIFPRVLAVDHHFRHKLSKNKNVKIAFVFSSDKKKAEQLAALMLEQRAAIANAPLKTVAISLDQLLILQFNDFSAIFVSEKLSRTEIAELVDLSISKSRIVFSPFIGDVERGATVGIMITSRVWPYLNMQTIDDSHINLNELLIKYAQRYE